MKTTIKERLEKLDYLQAYDLWNLWVLQNANPPDKWLLIQELSDLAAMDEDAAAELSDEIDKLLTEETSDNGKKQSPIIFSCTDCGRKELAVSEPDTPIEILVRGGCVYAVDNVPDGKIVEVHDYDIDGCESEILTDDDDEKYVLSIY